MPDKSNYENWGYKHPYNPTEIYSKEPIILSSRFKKSGKNYERWFRRGMVACYLKTGSQNSRYFIVFIVRQVWRIKSGVVAETPPVAKDWNKNAFSCFDEQEAKEKIIELLWRTDPTGPDFNSHRKGLLDNILIYREVV